MKNDSALFFSCSVIELIGRTQKLTRDQVVSEMGKECLRRLYKDADILHCEPIEKVVDTYIEMMHISNGTFDNVAKCKYTVPDYWTIGEVYERLIEDVNSKDIVDTLIEVYTSWISQCISNYNSDFYYQSRDYIAECYKAKSIL